MEDKKNPQGRRSSYPSSANIQNEIYFFSEYQNIFTSLSGRNFKITELVQSYYSSKLQYIINNILQNKCDTTRNLIVQEPIDYCTNLNRILNLMNDYNAIIKTELSRLLQLELRNLQKKN